MQIIKRRLKNALSNKIIKDQLSPYILFYIIIDPSQKVTNFIRKKSLTKLLFSNNFNSLKKNLVTYPINYVPFISIEQLLKVFNQLKINPDFNKILICNIKINELIFKNMNTFYYYNIHNNLLTFYKLYYLLNRVLFNFVFFKTK